MTAGTSALLIAIGGGVAGIAALTSDGSDAPRIVTAVGQAADTGAGTEAGAEPAALPSTGSGTNPAAPGMEPAVPGMEPAVPGMEPAVPGMEPAVPGMEPPGPRTKRAAPGMEPVAAPYGGAKRAATIPRGADKADRTGAREPRTHQPAAESPAYPPAPSAARPPAGPTTPGQPGITTRTEYEKREVPFQTKFVRDPTLPRGAKKVQSAGVAGEETLRYLVTLNDGREIDRELVDITVTRQPQHRVIAFGSRRGFDRPRGYRCEGKSLALCVPLGRKACPQPEPEESAAALGGSITVLDQDIELIDGEAVDELPQMHCAPKEPVADSRG
ncbi:surface rod structure-forming protein G [Paractinoplanes brasiliensis]|uniref:Surface rod structure-forming protein G n=4 Tax=Paractinoplanes brasiliensis TaxID=52695 RepID=A0A4R6JVJ5_9ACTN|nr:surface rod structure-forming protein G [Actinoplanes brasiliensis]